jgi:predicted HicB family RNase H-like nuclease
MERRLMKHGDYVAELRFDKADGLFRARVVNLERDSLDFCASSIDELPQEFARSVELYEEICRERGREPERPRPLC